MHKKILIKQSSQRKTITKKNVAEIICTGFRKLKANCNQFSVRRPRIIGKIPSFQPINLITALAGNFKVPRREIVNFVKKYQEEFVCMKRNQL